MKVLLIYANSMLENALPIGISQLAACLKEAGITVELFDTTFYRFGKKSSMEQRIEALQIRPCPLNFKHGNMEDEFRKKIDDFHPDLIGLSVVEPTFLIGMRLLESARQTIVKNKIPVAIGGVHAILAPETILKYDLIDYICISEGETAFVELCHRIEKGQDVSDTAGFWIKKDAQWIKNQSAAITDINKLPIMDFSIFEDAYLNKPIMGNVYRTISIETTRGCPYKCSYCGDHSLRTLFKDKGSWFRKKTMAKIEEELKAYISRYDPGFLYIMSESFLAGSSERVREFADMYRQFSIPFWFNTRPEDITPKKMKLVKDVGCKRVSIGLEHGNEEFRKKYLHRTYSDDLFRKACALLKEYEISFSVNVIIGFPYETRDMIFEAINILREIKPDGVSTAIFNPYHGIEMRDICVKEGMISPDTIAEDFFQGDYLLNNPLITKQEILGLLRVIPLYIEMDKSQYPRIKEAENLDERGNSVFNELKNEFYTMKGWH